MRASRLAHGCADWAERMATHMDVLVRRSARMRARSDAREPRGHATRGQSVGPRAAVALGVVGSPAAKPQRRKRLLTAPFNPKRIDAPCSAVSARTLLRFPFPLWRFPAPPATTYPFRRAAPRVASARLTPRD